MSSKRRVRRKSCEGKIKHPTAKDAQHAAAKMKGIYKQIFNSYHCKFCKSWHIGHPNRRARQDMKAKGLL